MYEIGNRALTTREHQQTTDKILSYVQHTSYFQHLRNHYHSFRELAKEEVKTLLKSGEVLRVSEEKNMMISFNQLTVCVVSYGDIFLEGKRYTIGKYFVIGTVKVDICFKEKSMIVMFSKDILEAEMQKYEDAYFKKKIIEKLMPAELKLAKSQIRHIIDSCLFRNSYYGEEVVKLQGSQLGVLLLLDGNFTISTRKRLKIGTINFDYFGEEVLWEKDYEYSLTAESSECRYIFLPRDTLAKTLTQAQLKTLRNCYSKRVHVRKELECSLDENISYTKQFMEKIARRNAPTIINPEYKEPIGRAIRKTVKQLRFQHIHLSQKTSTVTHSQRIDQRKLTTMTDIPSPRDLTKSIFYEEAFEPKQPQPQNFAPRLYKDQRAKSQLIFRRRVHSVSNEKQAEIKAIKEDRVTEKDLQNLKNLPKTLSVLLKYYESTERLRPRPKTVSAAARGGFVSCPKQRRLMTTMKLHKEVFMRQYFEIKTMEDRAFKTWR